MIRDRAVQKMLGEPISPIRLYKEMVQLLADANEHPTFDGRTTRVQFIRFNLARLLGSPSEKFNQLNLRIDLVVKSINNFYHLDKYQMTLQFLLKSLSNLLKKDVSQQILLEVKNELLNYNSQFTKIKTNNQRSFEGPRLF